MLGSSLNAIRALKAVIAPSILTWGSATPLPGAHLSSALLLYIQFVLCCKCESAQLASSFWRDLRPMLQVTFLPFCLLDGYIL